VYSINVCVRFLGQGINKRRDAKQLASFCW